ncbi:hypothetical protein AAKU61_003899 [Undibacterium sp. GrIS 1.2]|uniref:hypothetical protein n=1 Tax=Undibacterium sp. GrIS 1.2 TaxID=3143933 RepID=UPI003395DBC8
MTTSRNEALCLTPLHVCQAKLVRFDAQGFSQGYGVRAKGAYSRASPVVRWHARTKRTATQPRRRAHSMASVLAFRQHKSTSAKRLVRVTVRARASHAAALRR